ncbi:MAG: M15 family metallopeptidase [Lachnospiraceae bacterium]|nr:M15 family metallopeptidase [Lachnospiraceae bacterium]
MKQYGKPALLLIGLVIICGVMARSLSNAETLADYARERAETDTLETDDATETISTVETDSTVESGSTTETCETLTETASWEDEMQAARTTYQNGFYYEPIPDYIKERITGVSYPDNSNTAQISYDDLRYVSVQYFNFNDKTKSGELICNKAIAQDLVEIFYELYQNNYQIEKIRLVDEYNGDDELSMKDNNTSCFNYRMSTGSTSLSMHARGLAIDINPFFNPYVAYNQDGTETIAPAGSEYYADRSKEFAFKITSDDLCYRLFKEHGFTWGGDWNSKKDYQHFQKQID